VLLSVGCAGADDEDAGFGASTCDPAPDRCALEVPDADIDCDAGAPVSVIEDGFRMLAALDMRRHSCVRLQAEIKNARRYALHFGNSPSNNGYGGDGATFTNDSELWVDRSNLGLAENDLGSTGIILEQYSAIDTELDLVDIKICDGFVSFDSSVFSTELRNPNIFQIDGNEPDYEAGSNDQTLWMGINRTVAGGRVGRGVVRACLQFED
jgi:hypothetical protein